jgi:adenine-specific DNA-methyltransferase
MKPLTAQDPETHSPDIVAENVEHLKALFPEAFTEGKLDFEVLKQLLGGTVEERDEKYGLNWHGKRRARQLALTPSTGTLRPCPEDSLDWENTRNLMIEGDNLEVLKLLQKSYAGKVKLIYIDPPYNTGNDFIYPDDFKDSIANYLQLTGQANSEGAKLTTNTDASGRFHTDWLNMMYPRLKLARNLLLEDGLVFISIDDGEVANLHKLCAEVFGEENFVTTVIWQKVYSPKNSAKHFSEDHDFIVVYARNADVWRPSLLPRSDEANARYENSDNDPRGPWKPSDLTARNYYSKGLYEVTSPSGAKFTSGVGRYWRQAFEGFQELERDNRIWWGPKGDAMPAQKRFLTEVQQGMVPQTLWFYKDVGHTQEAKKELLKYVKFTDNENVLNSVKPPRLIQRMLQIATTADSGDLVLDFFGGSASTAHAVLSQNETDGGNRRFISVQLPEPLPAP